MKTALSVDLPAEAQPLVNAIHVQQLKLELQTYKVACQIFQAARLLWPDHDDYPHVMALAPTRVRDRMLRLAQQVVARVNEANEQTAVDKAEQAFNELVIESERDAASGFVPEHAKRFVERAVQKFSGLVRIVKPVRVALGVYAAALQKGGQ